MRTIATKGNDTGNKIVKFQKCQRIMNVEICHHCAVEMSTLISESRETGAEPHDTGFDQKWIDLSTIKKPDHIQTM